MVYVPFIQIDSLLSDFRKMRCFSMIFSGKIGFFLPISDFLNFKSCEQATKKDNFIEILKRNALRMYVWEGLIRSTSIWDFSRESSIIDYEAFYYYVMRIYLLLTLAAKIFEITTLIVHLYFLSKSISFEKFLWNLR